MFRISHYQRMVNNAIETMRLLRNNLLKIVRYRQNSIAVLHIKYHKLIPKILEELSRSVIEYHINSYNFNDLELEIESILQLINSDVNFDHQIASQYNKILA
jgi:aminoglycoside phosphotransferase family enzyme